MDYLAGSVPKTLVLLSCSGSFTRILKLLHSLSASYKEVHIILFVFMNSR